MKIEGYMTVAQAAERLNIAEVGVYAAIRRQRLEAQKFGKMWLITDESVYNYDETREPKGPRPKSVE